jgi:hypothetical protein
MKKKNLTLDDLAVIIKDGFDMMNGHFDKIDKKGKKNKNTINRIKRIKKKVI